MPVLGYRATVDGFIALHEADGAALGFDRAVGLPSLTVTVGEMVEAVQRVAARRRPGQPLGEITVEPDSFIERIVATWPRDAAYDRATALGLPRETDLDEIVEAYIEDYLQTDT
jgi:nucleoside-diphosphate-sugar epimerase